MKTRVVNSSDEWTVGQRYVMTYEVQGSQFYGNARVDSFVRRVGEDPKLRVERYTYKDGVLNLHVRAVQPSSPIHIVVAGIIAVAILFGLFLVLREIKQVLDEFDLPGGFNPLGLVLVGGGVLLLLHGFRRYNAGA